MVKISTSILEKNDIDTIKKLNLTDTDYLHIDVMDGIFVPRKSFSLKQLKEICKYTSKKLDVHLMVSNIENYLNYFDISNIEFITVHYEVLKDKKIINIIHNKGIKCGISINPNTNIKEIFSLLNIIDLVLIMGVEPGTGGQSFIFNTLNKIEELKQELENKNLNVLISVDGGIDEETANLCIEKGVDILVSGTFITNNDNYQRQINVLRIKKNEKKI
jgi:ribulose-phosphate 3-epimerase